MPSNVKKRTTCVTPTTNTMQNNREHAPASALSIAVEAGRPFETEPYCAITVVKQIEFLKVERSKHLSLAIVSE